jgi:fermentation-respiration switch protein FrsA (DUF1100 family)
MFKTLSIFACFLILFGAALYYFQHRLIYFPNKTQPHPEDWHLPQMQVVHFKTQDGLTLYGWYAKATAHHPTLVYLTGNAGHIGYRAPMIQAMLQQGFGVLIVSYRGYGGSPGDPHEQGLYNDAHAALQFIKAQHVPWQCTVLYGESIGAAVAIESAGHFPVAALILQAPFISLQAIAHEHYPLLPTRYLLRESYHSIDRIKHLTMPLLILHGDQDGIVSVAHGKALYEASSSSVKRLKIYPGYDHNNLDPAQIAVDIKKYIDHHLPHAC